MSRSYTFTKTVIVSRIHQEILDTVYGERLEYLQYKGGVLEIVMETALTGEQESALNTLVSNHVATPLEPEPWDFNLTPTVNGNELILTNDLATYTPVDARGVSGHIIPDKTHDRQLGSSKTAWQNIYSVSGVFTDIVIDGSIITPADFSELFECLDPAGIPDGFAVQISNTSGLIEKATSTSGMVGFVSARPGVVGDGEGTKWHGKYMLTDFGAYDLDVSGQPRLNPDWIPELGYTSRMKRSEWIPVGLLGKIWVRSYGETPIPGDYATLGLSGMVKKATTEDTKWLVVSSGLSFDITKGYGTARILYYK